MGGEEKSEIFIQAEDPIVSVVKSRQNSTVNSTMNTSSLPPGWEEAKDPQGKILGLWLGIILTKDVRAMLLH